MSHARISITLPPELLEAADRCAREANRSRSWVVAEALRLQVEKLAETAGAGSQVQVHETARLPYAALGLGESRTVQLEADLALTPEERVREAERTLALSELGEPAWRGDRLLMFDRFEDYLAWKRWAELAP